MAIGTRTRDEAGLFGSGATARAGSKRKRHIHNSADFDGVESFAERSDQSSDAKSIDASLYLQAMCKLVQTAGPGCEAMEYIVEDYGVGMVPEGICRMLALTLSELIRGAAACLPSDGIKPKVKIVLRRRGRIILCAVESRWLSESGAGAPSGIRHTQQMIAALGTSCMLRLMPEHNLIAIMLDTSKAEPRIANAIAAYRLARVAHRPFSPDAVESGHYV